LLFLRHILYIPKLKAIIMIVLVGLGGGGDVLYEEYRFLVMI
jgi:hypothetical protein